MAKSTSLFDWKDTPKKKRKKFQGTIHYQLVGQLINCGKVRWRYWGHKTVDEGVHLHKSAPCGNRDCRVHSYYGFAARGASRVMQRLNDYRKAHPNVIIQSAIVSVKAGSKKPLTQKALDALKAEAMIYLRLVGVKGECWIAHDRRHDEDGKYNDDSPDWIHWHLWVVGWIDPDMVAQIEYQTSDIQIDLEGNDLPRQPGDGGWVIKGEGRLENPWKRTRYELSHAYYTVPVNPATDPLSSPRQSTQCITWSGCLAYSKFHAPPEPEGWFCKLCYSYYPLQDIDEYEYRPGTGGSGPPELFLWDRDWFDDEMWRELGPGLYAVVEKSEKEAEAERSSYRQEKLVEAIEDVA